VATECESFNKDRELLQAQLEEALDERDTLQSRLLYLEAKQDTKDTTGECLSQFMVYKLNIAPFKSPMSNWINILCATV